MLLTISTSYSPATDLGHLLHKHPDRVHERTLSFGTARVCFPEASAQRCTAALIVDVDPIELVRGDGKGRGQGSRRGAGSFALGEYVNDRPYAASSFLSSAIGKMFGTAMSGRSKDRPELAEQPIPLSVRVPVLPCRGDAALVRQLFEPLGYVVSATPLPLDPAFPVWGDSPYLDVTLERTAPLKEVLEQLYVLLPVLDDDKHYWVGRDEVERLLRRAGTWLAGHPQRELITRRYLRHDRQLAQSALDQLLAADGSVDDPERVEERRASGEEALERPVRLNELRLRAVVEALRTNGARRTADVGCGQGSLLRELLRESWVERAVGIDVSWRALEVAARRLRVDEMTPRQRARVDLWHGSLMYRDRRLTDFDALCLVEVIEHVDPARLVALVDAVFASARPRLVVVTTPNVEYNVRFETLTAGSMRHLDHRFEWTRAEFQSWAAQVAADHGYTVATSPIGPFDDEVGAPTQMAVFQR